MYDNTQRIILPHFMTFRIECGGKLENPFLDLIVLVLTLTEIGQLDLEVTFFKLYLWFIKQAGSLNIIFMLVV